MAEPPHRLSIRVYYEDTDFSGAVYHANYLRFMERARTEFLRALGIEQASFADDTGQSLAFVVRAMRIDFLKPARMDDFLVVETVCGTIGGASLSLEQSILRHDAVLVSAQVKVALVTGGRVRRFPPSLAYLLSARFMPESTAEIVPK